jgi:tRNA(adenine34) deaminase
MTDAQAMQLALTLAGDAAQAGEVPVGAVVLKNGVLIASGRNAPIEGHDPTAHAEIVALRAAAVALGNYRLDDCELFVTLEPCAMCAGAMLHSRLKRVIFGATDPKTGAAGSVINLFANPQLNHHTQVQGGVLADACAHVLQDFFKKKRKQLRVSSSPVRDDALRTPEARFTDLPDFAWPPHYISDLPSLNGLRLHYLDEGPHEARLTYVCLHGSLSWSYLYRETVTDLLAAGHRVLVPDLPGFGKSDKPKKETFHTLTWHRQVLLEWLICLNVKHVVLLVPLNNSLAGLIDAMRNEPWCDEVRVVDMPFEPTDAPYQAPFPDRGHRAAQRAFLTLSAQAEKAGQLTGTTSDFVSPENMRVKP